MSKLIRKIQSRLRSRRGDSLGEVLIALLIVTLALVSLAAMISSTTGRILDSSKQTERYMQAENVLAAQDDVAAAGSVGIKDAAGRPLKLTDDVADPIPVSFYHDDDLTGPNPGVSYKVD